VYLIFPPGHVYNAVTNRLQTLDSRAINNALSIICKRVTQETKGLTLRVNSSTFQTVLVIPYQVGNLSNAALFKHFRQKRYIALSHILYFSHILVTAEVLRALYNQ
jgi:hypothetical protein